MLDADALRREEPYAAHDLPGGVLYPGDAQLEPRLATAALVRAAVARGAQLATGVVVERIVRGADGRATGVETATGRSTPTWSWSPPASGRPRCWRPPA